jgi:type IV secretion system protein VirB6
MFITVGTALDAVLNAYLVGVLRAVMGWVLLLATLCLTLYILLYGYAVARGEVAEPVKDFVWKAIKIGLIIAIATGLDAYTTYVMAAVQDATVSMATTFLPPEGPTSSPRPPLTNIWNLLQFFDVEANRLVLRSSERAPGEWIPNMSRVAAAVLFAIANEILLIVAFLVTLWAKVFQLFVLAVGPLFILSLMWRPTAKFFDAWLGMLLSTVVLTWLSFFVLGFSIGTGLDAVERLNRNFAALNLLGEALRYAVVMVVFAAMLYQAPSLAASLTGGGPSQYGAGIVQHSLQTYRLMRGYGGGPSPGGGGGGGVVARGAGLPYHAGRAAGSGFRAAGGAVRSVATRAYQRAAQIGRRT